MFRSATFQKKIWESNAFFVKMNSCNTIVQSSNELLKKKIQIYDKPTL